MNDDGVCAWTQHYTKRQTRPVHVNMRCEKKFEGARAAMGRTIEPPCSPYPLFVVVTQSMDNSNPSSSRLSPAPESSSLGARVALAAADIKLHHSVFALPFAVLGAFAARPELSAWSRFAGQLGLVVACMVAARTWAMLINRLADAKFDAANPRTARRAVASGQLSVRDARLFCTISAVLFMSACGLFWVIFYNPWPLALSVPVLAWLALYSYAKRFTAWCHLLLGSALAISPIAAAIAIDPSSLARVPALYAIAGMVMLWVGGFDIVYALQDTEFDRRVGLFSIPARFGPRGAVMLSRAMHVLAIGCLTLAAVVDVRLRGAFPFAVGVAAVLLIAEHVVLSRRGLAGLPLAFFTINGVVSCVVGAAGVFDLVNR